MYGILGTTGSLGSDISLISTLVFGLIASYGAIQAHRKNFTKHCPMMAIAALLNWVPVLFLMIPVWVGIVNGTQALAAGTLRSVPIIHGTLGLITQLMMTYTVIRMYWVKTLPPQKTIWLMRTTITLWMLTILGGLGVYTVVYLI